jgi:hypothetical protein
LLKLPPTDPKSPQEIIRRVFAWAKATIARALDRAESAILALNVSYFVALIISWMLKAAVMQFLGSLNKIVAFARRKKFPPITILADQINGLSEINDALTSMAEETVE